MNKLLVVAGISAIIIAAAAAAALSLNSSPEPDIIPYDGSNSTETISPETPETPSTSSSGSSSSTTAGSSGSEDSGTADTETEQPDTNDSEEDQSSRIYFDVSVKTFETEHQIFQSDTDEILFSCYGYVSWEPVTYVRYYEVTLHFNGNNLPNEDRYSGSNYRTWGKEGHELIPFPWSENKTLVVGPQSVAHMFQKIYRGPYNTSGTWLDTKEDGTIVYGPKLWPDTQHGIKVIGLMTTFNREDWQENLSPTQIAQIETQMRQFLAEYTRGWTVSIRAVS